MSRGPRSGSQSSSPRRKPGNNTPGPRKNQGEMTTIERTDDKGVEKKSESNTVHARRQGAAALLRA